MCDNKGGCKCDKTIILPKFLDAYLKYYNIKEDPSFEGVINSIKEKNKGDMKKSFEDLSKIIEITIFSHK